MPRQPFAVIPEGSITSTPGFRAAGVACGLKPTGAPDLALVYSPTPCTAAAMFTTNAFQAAPVLYDRETLAAHPRDMHGVVINSGCANACTGDRGLQDARATADHAGEALGVPGERMAVMSTGVIGAYLPMDKIHAGIALAVEALGEGVDAGHAAARAIMTTDTRPKEVAVRVAAPGGEYTVAGMAKGAGMIAPNMATLLSVLTTDAALDPAPAQAALREAVEAGFNLITVDGDTSTNDMAIVLSSGKVGADLTELEAALTDVCVRLAKKVARDGEGATKLITVRVTGGRSVEEARQAARTVAGSNLIKSAVHGADPNWGRILAAIGRSGAVSDLANVRVAMQGTELYRGGPVAFDAALVSQRLRQEDVLLEADLAAGNSTGEAWGCDLSPEYVRINADYTT